MTKRVYQIRPQGPAKPGLTIDYAAELNAEQLAAVEAAPGPALVIAGAGSGKTRTLTYRVAYLLENGIDPRRILLLTFTNKAAREMLERVAMLVNCDTAQLWGGTFHSVGNRILRRHPEAAGLSEGFTILDRDDVESLWDGVAEEVGKAFGGLPMPKGNVLAELFSYQVNAGRPMAEVVLERFPALAERAEVVEALAKGFRLRKERANAVDFDDLIVRTVGLLRDRPEIAEFYQRQFQFLLIDEYQDTNPLQAEFIGLLAARHRNVMAVGDDAQAIYSWRGADIRNMLDFTERYPGATVYKIEQNYRSTPQILGVANAVISGNRSQFPKELRAVRPSGCAPGIARVMSSADQAALVAQRIEELVDEGVDPGEIAVLYRAHFHSMEIQMELTRRHIPFGITSGLRFFEQAHVKDVASVLKFLVNATDEMAFKRVVRLMPGVGVKAAETIWNAVRELTEGMLRPVAVVPGLPEIPGDLAEDGFVPVPERDARERLQAAAAVARELPGLLRGVKVPAKAGAMWGQFLDTLAECVGEEGFLEPATMLRSIVEGVYDDHARLEYANYDLRREDLMTLVGFAGQYTDPMEFLDQLALVSSVERPEEEEGESMVTLSSVHQAKGLEWKAVFVVWMAEGAFPSGRSMESEAAMEEERRLFYVAVTRAREQLLLTFPYMRTVGRGGGGDTVQRPSRFLGEIPEGLLEEWEITGGAW
jgi:DNA helicase-2/ATP-dependent DNA helicase PcrA